MSEAQDMLRRARSEGAPDLPIEALLGGSDAWQSVFDEIDVAVRATIDAIDDVDEAAALVGQVEVSDQERGAILGRLSERSVESVTSQSMYDWPASEIVPLWRALAAAADDAAAERALDGADPADDIDDVESAITLVANDERELGEARFESPVDAVWEPIERVIVACVDGRLKHRFGRARGA